MPSPVLSAEEIAQRQSFAESQDTTVFTVFEGVCPECYHDLHLSAFGGLPEFYQWNHLPLQERGIEGSHWEPSPDGFGSIGFKAFTCSNGHTTEVYQTRGFDWTCSR